MDTRGKSDPEPRLTRREDALAPVEVSLPEAQRWVNFVVHEPSVLPTGCRVERTTVRPEQPPGRPGGLRAEELGQTPWSEANPCSARTVVVGVGRSLRVKQFLYDWAPPAAWIAPLWDTPWLEPVDRGSDAGWLGRDYRDALGACIQLARTQIEVSVLEGEFAHAELHAFLRGLAPSDPTGARRVRRTPFHRLNYWVRYRVPPYRVPYGLWKYPHRRLYDSGRYLTRAALGAGQGVRVLLPPAQDYAFDSALLIDDPALSHREVEVLLRRRGRSDGTVWISCLREGSEVELPVPPEPETQTAAVREDRSARGGRVWFASLTRERGAHEAFWSERGHRYALWTAPARGYSDARFAELVESLAPL